MSFLRPLLSSCKTKFLAAVCFSISSLIGQVAAQGIAPYFDGVFPDRIPGLQRNWYLEDTFPRLSFVDPLWLTQIPGKAEFLVVTKSGKIFRFPRNPQVTYQQVTEVLDISNKVQLSEDQGAYSLAFHPQFGTANAPNENTVFICYNYKPIANQDTPDKSMWRVSKFRWIKATGTIAPESEEVLIQQYDPHRWHNGGAMHFDKHGFLLIACGDGGGADNEFGKSQLLANGFFGGILRIDVDNNSAKSNPIRRQPLDGPGKPASFPSSFSAGYGIPKSNPWIDALDFGEPVLEEFYAFGLRSPHGVHYDSVSDELWAGDVGQFEEEELNRVVKGGNYEWPEMEGTRRNSRSNKGLSSLGTPTPPAYRYDRTVGSCIIGGPIYRGTKWSAELRGKVIFGDNVRGTISTYAPDGTVERLMDSIGGVFYHGLSNFMVDSIGDVYLLRLNGQSTEGGKILKFAKGGTTRQPPTLLSQTGLFTNVRTLAPSVHMIPYQVASELWSDGASKKRWMVLPSYGNLAVPARINTSTIGNWQFPAGTILVKHFEIQTDKKNPASIKRLETRVIVVYGENLKYGLTYRWNAAGTDATLLTSGAQETISISEENGSKKNLRWNYPSRSDCMQCHTDSRGHSLGIRTHQLNMTVIDPVTKSGINQLDLLQSYLTHSAADLKSIVASRSLTDETAPMEARVRSYLDTNCAHCHNPGSIGLFDARLTTSLNRQNIINAIASGHNHAGEQNLLIKPGDASQSLIHTRHASTTTGTAMPPIGRETVNPVAEALIRDYINELDPTHFSEPPTLTSRYIRVTEYDLPPEGHTEMSEISVSGVSRQNIRIFDVNNERYPNSTTNLLDGSTSGPQWFTEPGIGGSVTLDLSRIYPIYSLSIHRRSSRPASKIRIELSDDAVEWTTVNEREWRGTNLNFSNLNLRRIRTELAGPKFSYDDTFDVTAVFDETIYSLTAEQISVQGGQVVAVTGGEAESQGHYFTITVKSTSPLTTVQIKENVIFVNDSRNSKSNIWTFVRNFRSYEDWAQYHGVSSSSENDLSDTDGDGIPQIMEYALGLDPRKSDYEVLDPDVISQGLPLITRNQETGKLNMTVRLRRGGLPLKYTAEFTSDFLNFDRQVITIPNGESNGWHQETIMDAFSTGAEPKRFGRLRIERE